MYHISQRTYTGKTYTVIVTILNQADLTIYVAELESRFGLEDKGEKTKEGIENVHGITDFEWQW